MQLVEDARNLARAEIRLVKARGFDLVRRWRTALILLVIALVAVQGAIIALMVGLVLQLAAIVGGAFAGLIVMAAMLAIASLLAWIALRAFSGSGNGSDKLNAAETVA